MSTIEFTDFRLALEVILFLVGAAAFMVTLYVAIVRRRWRRTAANLVLTGMLMLYWLAMVIARTAYDYVGPSYLFTVSGGFMWALISVHFLGIAWIQKDEY